MITSDPRSEDCWLTPHEIETLKELSTACGGWIVWDDNVEDDELPGRAWVPLAEWEPRFAEHEARRNAQEPRA